MKSSFRTIALIGKYKSPEVAEPLLTLARFLERRKVKVLIDPLTAGALGQMPAGAPPGMGSDAVRRLQEAKQMLDAKLITDSEYEAIKAKIVSL